jgi:hypothetical protein
MFLDGKSTLAPQTQLDLDQSLSQSTFVNIQGAFNVEGNTINVVADFLAYNDIANAKAYIAVNEKTTTGNVGTNGEKEFHHIMMKMLTSAQGESISINAGEIHHFEYSFDMSSTHVEEMSDLEVAMWLQNPTTKEVYNSKFAMEYTEHLYAVENLSAEIVGDAVTFVINWNKSEKANPIGYNIYLDGELIEENYTETSYSDESAETIDYLEDGNQHIVEVVAVYENGTSVGSAVLVTKGTNVSEITENNISVYPNPANDFVKLSAVSGQLSVVKIYNCLGMMVEEIEVNANEVEINISEYNTGIYFVNVQTENGNLVKKVVKK